MKNKLIVLLSITFVLISCQQPNKTKAKSTAINNGQI